MTLLTNLQSQYEFDSIDQDANKPDTQIITFKERYVAEMFLNSASQIPDIDKADLNWVPNTTTSVKKESDQANNLLSDGDATMEDSKDQSAIANGANDTNGNMNGGDADLDVADDEDRWMGA